MDFQLSPGDLPSLCIKLLISLKGLGLEISGQHLNALKQQIQYIMRAYVQIFFNTLFKC